MRMADFDTWADLLSDGQYGSKISKALQQAFEQGRSLGHREGYEEGLNRGWAIEQDKELAKCTLCRPGQLRSCPSCQKR